MHAIETTGTVDAQHQLRLDEPLPIPEQSRVRVIVLVPDEEDFSEVAWMKAVSANPELDFLKDTTEEVYTAADGKPFHAGVKLSLCRFPFDDLAAEKVRPALCLTFL